MSHPLDCPPPPPPYFETQCYPEISTMSNPNPNQIIQNDPYILAQPQLRSWPGDPTYHDSKTGEMLVRRSDGADGLVHTKLYFFPVSQSLPADASLPEIAHGRTESKFIPPWAHADPVTASDMVSRVRQRLADLNQGGVKVIISVADANAQFPLSHPQFQIAASQVVDGQLVRARINAGLLAQQIGRSTATVDGEVKQFPIPAVNNAVDELLRELAVRVKETAGNG